MTDGKKGVPPAGSGHSPKGGARKRSPAKPSVPNAVRRAFRPFEEAPRDGTPFCIPYIVRYNPFAKTFEALYRDQMSGETEWAATPRIWHAQRYCDLLPLSFEPPKTFSATYIARRLTRWERFRDWLRSFLPKPRKVVVTRSAWKAVTSGAA